MIFFFENLSLLPETSAPKEHFKLVFGSGNSDLAKIRPLKVWTSWISPWVPPYGILPHGRPFFSMFMYMMFVSAVREMQHNRAQYSLKYECHDEKPLILTDLDITFVRAELAFSPSSEKWPGNTFLDVKSRLESIARIGLLKKNDPEVAYGR